MADEKTPPQHTPTPWSARQKRGDGDSWWVMAPPPRPGHRGFLAECVGRQAENGPNAAYIVKAANCHDELIAALRFCYATLSNVVHIEKRLQIEVDAIARARLALAKADASVEDVGER